MATGFAISRCSASAYQRAVVYLSRRQQFHALSSLTAKSRFLKLNNLTRNCSSSSNAPFIVAEDEKYGNKQVISITPRLYDYILANVREPQILRQLREETANMRGSQMQVSPDQAQLLAMLVQILGAERCIEIGVYTGYSSLAIALALPESGCLVACERDARSLEVAKKYYELAGVSQKVIVKHGLAADALKSMILNGEACSYDFAFVDAEKRMNQEYFELLLQLVRVGGLIVVDNVLWHGKVADPLVNDAKTVSIRNFNRNVMEDKRVSISMVPSGLIEGQVFKPVRPSTGPPHPLKFIQTGDEEAAAEVPVRSSLFRYNSPLVQVSLIGLVCFCCPGMFNALSGMGGGGQVDPTAANNANTALYTTFSVFGILGGGIYNIFGPRITLAVGCSTYVLYAGSFLYYNHHHDQTFPIIAGGLLGVGAGLLWAGQGAIMTSYPTPDRKGTYISLFWTIFNLGGVMGGLIPFILNYHRENSESVNDKTYITFMCFMSAGALISSAILSPDRVVRDDGTRCTNIKYSNVYIEAFEIVKLFRNWKLRLIIPAAWASNFFYTYQFNNFNGLKFNLRTRGLNNVFYWGAQMIGSVGIGYVLDFSFKSRRTRGLVGIGVVAVLGTAIWGGGLASQYAGFYKGAQSAGAAVAWQVDKHKVPLLNQLIINWALTTLSYPLLGLLVYLAVKDDSKSAEDAETASGFPPPASIKDGYEEVGKSTPAAERDASQVPGKST
ncbi:hypothetical protein SCA6_014921 [Theobroma cacao]